MSLSDLLSVARADKPADLLLRNGRLINVFNGEIESTDIAIFNGKIAGIGPGYSAHRTIDLNNSYIAPGLIDAHVHIESSLCVPAHFAAAVMPRGVTTVITDPHEIANVAGIPGIRFMADSRRGIPLRIEIMAPSCVPATNMGTSGATLNADDLASLIADGTVHGLAEVMNFPAVIQGEPSVLNKLAAFTNRPIDGHCPGVTKNKLSAYIATGIASDHEAITPQEAKEKLARGLYIFIREATNAHNLAALLPMMTPTNNRRICFCTDDRQPADLLTQGTIDHMLRTAIAFGIDPIDAFRAATLNPAEYFRLNDRGAIAPGRRADLFIFDNLKNPTAKEVYIGGKSVRDYQSAPIKSNIANTCRVDFGKINLTIPAKGKRIRVIGALSDQLLTEHRILDARIENGFAIADPQRDILKIAVIERHGKTNNIGLGFIQGIGLKRGAIAGTVAHDHHNLVVIGTDDQSMLTAARTAAQNGGGLAAADGVKILSHLPLPVAGLMSDQPIDQVRQAYDALLAAAASFGSSIHDPFMAMSFMALEVIPALKLTDQGLIDVEKFSIVDLFV